MGEVGHPGLVRAGGGKLPQKIRIGRQLVSGLFPRLFASSPVGFNSEEFHYSLHPVLSRLKNGSQPLVAVAGFLMQSFLNPSFKLPIFDSLLGNVVEAGSGDAQLFGQDLLC